MDVTQQFSAFGLVPVIVIDDAADAVPLARALASGGLPVAEVTCRTPAAMQAIRNISDAEPGMLLGAGTVLSEEQAAQALDAGARFIVAPGFNPAVVGYCLERGVPVIPGVNSPTEIEAALRFGLDVLKFFPAEASGGIGYLKAMAGPYGNVRFMPTGGINSANLASYLDWDRVIACGGSWLAERRLVAEGCFEEITARTRRALAAVMGLRLVRVELFFTPTATEEALCSLLTSFLGTDASTTRIQPDVPTEAEQQAGRLGRLICTTRDASRTAAFFARMGLSALHCAGSLEIPLAGYTLRIEPDAD